MNVSLGGIKRSTPSQVGAIAAKFQQTFTRYEINSRYAFTGDLFEKEEDISDPSIWKEMGDPNLQKIQSSNRWKILNAADFIVPGHGPMFRVDEEMKLAMREQLLKDGVDVDDDDCTK